MHDDGTDDEVVLVQVSINNGMTMVQNRRITDLDGDGVEDNVEKTRDELDRFFEPAVFGVAEDLYNTHHGNFPGHVRLEEYEGAPEDLHIHF